MNQLKELQGKTFPVLDDGFVRVVDAFGSDQRVIEAARLTSQATGKGPTEDRNLLRYLLRHEHGTPFEFPVLTVHIRIPMDSWRQGVRHRVFSINEYSTRYSEAIDSMARTDPDKWRTQSKVNRQGSSDTNVDKWPAGYEIIPETNLENGDVGYAIANQEGRCVGVMPENLPPGEYLSYRERKFQDAAVELYQERLAFGVAKEVARKDLPLSNYTELYWQANLRNWLHFLGLRMDSHAQWEIRAYANVIGEEIIAKLFPWTWEAFCDYQLNAATLTALDQVVIQNLANCPQLTPPYPVEMFLREQHHDWKDLKSCREREECLAKLQALGLVQTEALNS